MGIFQKIRMCIAHLFYRVLHKNTFNTYVKMTFINQ